MSIDETPSKRVNFTLSYGNLAGSNQKNKRQLKSACAIPQALKDQQKCTKTILCNSVSENAHIP